MKGASYAGTAGVMLDFSFAAGLEPILSSFSRRVFSWEMILRVAMVMSELVVTLVVALVVSWL